ncbi:MAG: substrate-binding domain-containing protein [Candidatus Omnitrophota bacterium]
MKNFIRIIVFMIMIVSIFVHQGQAAETLRLATTTSTYETGLLDSIIPKFEQDNDCKVHIISVGTGKAITLAKNGDVDVLLVHARQAEDKFVEEGYGVNRRDVMYNDFIMLGPQNDPAKINGLTDAAAALEKIYKAKLTFVSRGDDSGTDKKEKHLWSKTGLVPGGEWYLETGQGMNATLRVADEKNAYVMLDRATFLFNQDKIKLIKVVEGDKEMLNPYGVIAVNPDRHPHVNYKLSMALVEWLTSVECQGMIDQYKINGNQLFHANYTGLKSQAARKKIKDQKGS